MLPLRLLPSLPLAAGPGAGEGGPGIPRLAGQALLPASPRRARRQGEVSWTRSPARRRPVPPLHCAPSPTRAAAPGVSCRASARPQPVQGSRAPGRAAHAPHPLLRMPPQGVPGPSARARRPGLEPGPARGSPAAAPRLSVAVACTLALQGEDPVHRWARAEGPTVGAGSQGRRTGVAESPGAEDRVLFLPHRPAVASDACRREGAQEAAGTCGLRLGHGVGNGDLVTCRDRPVARPTERSCIL